MRERYGLENAVAAWNARTPSESQRLRDEHRRLHDALLIMWKLYDKGEPCYENPEELEGYLGKAALLKDEE